MSASNNGNNKNANKNGVIPSCTILYSTQSKRAKACARRTARILREKTRLQLLGGTAFDEIPNSVSFVDLASAKKRKDEHFFLFFVSTTGDGEHCDTIQQTWKSLLKKSLPADIFEGNQFALFCLGDRAYGPQFCAAGRKLAVRLMQLGMKTKCEVGYGDDNTPNGGVFNDLDDWIQEQLLISLSEGDFYKDQAENTTASSSFQLDTTEYDIKGSGEIPPATGLEEWQQVSFAESYKAFFARQSPIMGYTYNGIHRVEDHTGTDQPNPPLLARVAANDRLTASEWEQNTRHIKLKVTNPSGGGNDVIVGSDHSLPYQAGDIATILPSNSPEEVEKFIQTLPDAVQAIVDQDIELIYKKNNSDGAGSDAASFGGAYPFWPAKCTLRGWLTYCADIHALPEREDLRALSQFCSPKHDMYQDQRDKLFGFSETQESALYADYVLRNKRGWGDVLYDFDSLRFPGSLLTAQALLTLLPPIRPRDFSIASSPSQEVLAKKRQPSEGGDNTFSVELCVAVVEGTTPLGRKYHGLCSHYLSQLQANKSLVRLWIRPGSFAGLPLEKSATSSDNHKQWFAHPMICIGAGTGVAPLRALILEREAIKRLAQNDNHHDPMAVDETGDIIDQFDNILVFGCRKEEVDYYYQEEWNQLHKSGRLYILPAFSRADPTRKVYVQQKIKANGDAIMKYILENDGAIYIAGNPSMARYSKEELMEAAARLLGENGEKKANILFKKLQARGRFSVEAWS